MRSARGEFPPQSGMRLPEWAKACIASNIGANKDKRRPGIARLCDRREEIWAPLGDYLNGSTSARPITPRFCARCKDKGCPGKELLAAVMDAMGQSKTPVLLKVAPDHRTGPDSYDIVERIAMDQKIRPR